MLFAVVLFPLHAWAQNPDLPRTNAVGPMSEQNLTQGPIQGFSPTYEPDTEFNGYFYLEPNRD